jgi:hypothetical protein
VSRRFPFQRPHGFDRVGCRVAYPARNLLVVKAIHVLQCEFANRNVGAYLLNRAVMIDQGFGYQRLRDGFGRYRRRTSRAPHFRQALFKVR